MLLKNSILELRFERNINIYKMSSFRDFEKCHMFLNVSESLLR